MEVAGAIWGGSWGLGEELGRLACWLVGWAEVQRPVVGVEAATDRAAGPIAAAAAAVEDTGCLSIAAAEADRAVVEDTGCPSIVAAGSPGWDSLALALALAPAPALAAAVDAVDVSRQRTPSPSPFPSRAIC